MKQKRYDDILFVFEQEPYKITRDTDADLIVVEYDSYPGFLELNPDLEDKLYAFNYSIIRCTTPFYKHDIDLPDYEISAPVISINSLENQFTVIPGTVTPAYSDSILTLVRIFRADGQIVRTFSFSAKSFTFDYSDYNFDGYYVMARTMIPKYEVSSDWSSPEKIVKTPDYFCIIPRYNDTVISFKTTEEQPVYYSTDKRTWTVLNKKNNYITDSFSEGQKVYFKGDLQPVYVAPILDYELGIGKIIAYNINDLEVQKPGRYSTAFDLSGKILSLLYSTDFEEINSLVGKARAFSGLFYDDKTIRPTGSHGVVDASRLKLPEIQELSCYEKMFYGNASLEKGPVIKGNVVRESCYEMFRYCTNIREVTLLTETIEPEFCLFYWLANIRQDQKNFLYCKEGMGDILRDSGNVPFNFEIVEIQGE